MKLLKSFVALSMMAFFATNALSQKIKLVEGDLSFLKGEKSVNTEFTYDNMSVGRFAIEKEYIDKKIVDYNKMESGKGDSWAKTWISDRKIKYEPRFNETFETVSGLKVNKDSKYTLIFHTLSTEPGIQSNMFSKAAEINAEITFVETANRSKILAKISLNKALGINNSGGYDYNTGLRIAESYASAGKALQKFIRKSID